MRCFKIITLKCVCGHSIREHDHSYGIKYCYHKGCKCEKFKENGYINISEREIPWIQIPIIEDDGLYGLISAFLTELNRLGLIFISNGTSGGALTSNMYYELLQNRKYNCSIIAKTFEELSEKEIIENMNQNLRNWIKQMRYLRK